MKKPKQLTEAQQVDQYLMHLGSQPGHFARTGWQTWLHLAIHEPQSFPVPMKKFLDTCISPMLVPVPTNSLDLMLRAWWTIYGEGMVGSTLVPFGYKTELTQEQRREKKWESLTSSMNTLLTRHLLNLPGSTIAGARSRELQRSSEET